MFDATSFRDIVSGRRRGFVAAAGRAALTAFEFPYRKAICIRNARFDQGKRAIQRVEVPVISVGNLTLGGTGKTPFVAWLCRWFRQQGVRVAVVSRGYGAKGDSQNDEAKELESRLPDVPHLQNPNRVAAATVAIDELATQLIVLDDAFQHRGIHRDLDILLIDATEPFGYGRVFPRGFLREPLSEAKRADLIAITKSENAEDAEIEQIKSKIRRYNTTAPLLRTQQQPRYLLTASSKQADIEVLKDANVAALCAIGNPDAFRQTLVRCGAHVAAFREFPDHHTFTPSDIRDLTDWAVATNAERIICTHKDLVKLNVDRLGSKPLHALVIDVNVQSGETELIRMLQPLAERALSID